MSGQLACVSAESLDVLKASPRSHALPSPKFSPMTAPMQRSGASSRYPRLKAGKCSSGQLSMRAGLGRRRKEEDRQASLTGHEVEKAREKPKLRSGGDAQG